MKKTKIVATMSDFRCTEEFVKQLFDAGMDVVRVNSAHVSEDGATHIVETVHRVNPAIPIIPKDPKSASRRSPTNTATASISARGTGWPCAVRTARTSRPARWST